MFSIYLLDSSKLFQWDLNRKIKIVGKEEVDEVHFSHIGDEEALVVKPIKENNILIANIPNILLQENKDIFVYLVSKDKTLKETFFTVGRREKPTDYLYTEIDILNYSSLEKRLAELEEKLNNISVEETDPTVPDWAKQPNKPKYTAAEVGALSSTETVRQLAQKQDKSNLVTSINESSVDSTYPSTRAVYEYVGEEFARLVGSAPDALDTIEELANAFNNNQDVLDALNASITSKQDKTDSVGVKTTQGGEIFNNYNSNTANALYAHAEGSGVKANGASAHAEGIDTEANQEAAHAEGRWTSATSKAAHSEGFNSVAGGTPVTKGSSPIGDYELGSAAHAEGIGTFAKGTAAHAEGYKTQAIGNAAHAEGKGNLASGDYQHVQGKYNVEDTANKYAHIVGNGEDANNRSNAHTIDWEGNAEYQGDVLANACNGENPISLIDTANALNDKITTPSKSAIGQILEVEEVDGEGKPTKWKCVEKPEVVTTTTDDKGKVVTVDSEGNKILEYPSMISYKYADKIQESNKQVLFCFDTAKPNLGLFSMPNKITTFRVYKDGVYIQGADLKTYNAFIELNVIDCNETRIFVIGKLAGSNVVSYFYYFSSNKWSVETEMLPLESLENMFIQRPDEAEVGQILVVKAVDENGKPIEWEVIDAPTGSGEDGYSPIATVEQTETGATISIQDKNGTTTAVVNHGADGKDGKDGYTPQKGIDYFDGKEGLNGKDGDDGKTAYQYAKDGGYTGTEKEFAQKMAKEIPTKLSDLENDSDFIKNTDYATKDKAGIAKIYPTSDKNVPGVGLSGNNILGIVSATNANIDEKTTKNPITPTNLDYAVKSAMTTNTLEWTEEEKQSARDLIGASDTGVEITDGEPTKESTVMTLNPNAEEVNLCTEEDFNAFKEEIDAKFDAFINAEEVSY